VGKSVPVPVIVSLRAFVGFGGSISFVPFKRTSEMVVEVPVAIGKEEESKPEPEPEGPEIAAPPKEVVVVGETP
jgi:hypothetical protein